MYFKLVPICVLTFGSFLSQAQTQADSIKHQSKKSHIRNKESVIQSSSTVRNINNLEEGYTSLEGGKYIIKDMIVKGQLNLICITDGIALASGTYNSGKTFKRYYLQRDSEKSILKEVFLTKKHAGTVGKVLANSTQLDRNMFNTPKSAGGMIDITKATLKQMMADKPSTLDQIENMEKISVSALKKLVKSYNAI